MVSKEFHIQGSFVELKQRISNQTMIIGRLHVTFAKRRVPRLNHDAPGPNPINDELRSSRLSTTCTRTFESQLSAAAMSASVFSRRALQLSQRRCKSSAPSELRWAAQELTVSGGGSQPLYLQQDTSLPIICPGSHCNPSKCSD